MSTEHVGSLAEEAAKLIAAMQGWAQDVRTTPGGHGHDSGDGHESHHDPLSPECRFCPLCMMVRVAKAATPEVRDHLATAALSLAMAFKGLMDNASPQSEAPTPVEKIDLTED